MITFEEIKQQQISNLDILIDANKYFAHKPKKSNKSKETLQQHILLVENYFLKIIEENKLELIIDDLIKKQLQNFRVNQNLSKFVKILFYNSIVYHDFGKINHLFQKKKMDNLNPKIESRNHKEGSNHAAIGAYLFMVHNFKTILDYGIDEVEQVLFGLLIPAFSFPINKHHSSNISRYDETISFSIENLEILSLFLSEFKVEIEKEDLEMFHVIISRIDNSLKQVKELGYEVDFFPLFALIKLNYSLLTAADYYATADYMSDIRPEKDDNFFGLIDDKTRNTIIKGIETTEKYNTEIIFNADKYLKKDLSELQAKGNENLNFIRKKMGAEVLSQIENHKNDRTFYIEAPTGGGKTNMSMLAVYKMLKLHKEINKVFYVFPFTTLVTQTHKSIIDTFNLTEQEVAQIHSKASYQSNNADNEEDAKYGDELKNYIDHVFVNYPIALMTHIKFFDILKSNNKKSNYLLHRLANSVVIIDELQAYDPRHWDKIKYFISKYSESLNIRFIVMSATLPRLDKLSLTGEKFPEYVELVKDVKDAKDRYLINPNFSKRVSIKTDLLGKEEIDISELAEIAYEKSESYAKSRTDKFTCSVYTIIEFIFKKSATEFREKIKNQNLFEDYEIFVLSGTILEPRRKFILEFLKDANNRKKKVLLITTQVVEAGVDIDMDLGFKNQSLLDSDEQLAGRINRNVNKQNCELWLFNYNKAKTIYGKDLRYKMTREMSVEEKQDIRENKKFDKLYKLVMQNIDKNNESSYKTGFLDYKKYFSIFDFDKINSEFKIIDNDNASIFVSVNIPIHCYGTEKNFSDTEIEFLKQNECLVCNEQEVSGEEVWKLFVKTIENKTQDFNLKQIELKKLNGIMSKFVFSIYSRNLEIMRDSGFIDYDETKFDYKVYQYFKLHSSEIGDNKLYSYKKGLDESKLADCFGIF